MRFKHLYIENFRSYKSSHIDFCEGVTVISGPNGSGKSSILEACYIGLFGAAALSGTGLQIADMVSKGESKSTIILDFDHLGKEYQIEQQFRISKSGSGSNSVSILTENGIIVADQSRKTYSYICDILNMDEQAYRNCAYIRQGEVDDLINARPKDRQTMIDDLLRLGKLEEYRERAAICKTSIGRQVRVGEERKKDFEEKIEEIEEKRLPEKLKDCREKIAQQDNNIRKINEEKEETAKNVFEFSEKIKTYEEKQKELHEIKDSINLLNLKLKEDKIKAEENIQALLNTEKKRREIEEAVKKEISDVADYLKRKDNEKFLEWAKKTRSKESIKELINESIKEPIEETVDEFKLSSEDENPENFLKKLQAEERLYRDWTVYASSVRKDAENKHISELKEIRRIENQIKDYTDSYKESEAEIEKADKDMISAQEIIERNIEFIKNKRNEYKELLGVLVPNETYLFLAEGKTPESNDQEGWSKWYGNFDEMDKNVNLSLQAKQKEIGEIEVENASLKSELNSKKEAIEGLKREVKSISDKVEKASIERNIQIELNKKIESLISEQEIKIKMRKQTLSEIVKSSSIQIFDLNSADLKFTEAYNKNIENEKQITVLLSKKERIEKEKKKYKELIDAGKCPTCGQTVNEDHLKNCFSEEKQDEVNIEKLIETAESKKLKTLADIENIKNIQKIFREIKEIEAELKKAEAEQKGIKNIIDKHTNDVDLNRNLATELKTTITAEEIKVKTSEDVLDKKEKVLKKYKNKYEDHLKISREIGTVKKDVLNSVRKILELIPQKESLLNKKAEKKERINELYDKIKIENEKLKSAEDVLNKLKTDVEDSELYEKEANLIYTEKKNMVDRAESISQNTQRLKLLDAEIKSFEKSKEHISKSIAEKNREINEKRLKEKELSESVKDENSHNKYKELLKALTEYIKKLKVQSEEANKKRSELQRKVGLIEGELKLLNNYRDNLKILDNKNEYISYVLEDVGLLESMYLRIRSDMRSKNIEALDQLLNKMFSFIYSNNAYSHIELDGDYNLRVYEKNGVFLEPKLLSGGERALFNLSLRCAIYQLLSYGYGEHTDNNSVLPPMILDEPTVFLDSGHVRQLIKLIELMKNEGVGQIIVVSHDESLIDSADTVYTVYKDTTTNTSNVSEYGEHRCLNLL